MEIILKKLKNEYLLFAVLAMIFIATLPEYKFWVITLFVVASIIYSVIEVSRLKNNKAQISSSAPPVDLEMLEHYPPSKNNRLFAHLYAFVPSNVAAFTFLDFSGKPIGNSTKFELMYDRGNRLQSNYFIEPDDQKIFLESVYKQNGIIKAEVRLTNGERWIYSYKSDTGNWKVVTEENKPNLGDTFTLIKQDKK